MSYDTWLEPPDPPTLLDMADTKCPGVTEDGDQCEDRSTCPACNAEVCSEHDETDECEGYVVHEECHKDGCYSAACEQDRHDDYLLAQAGM